MAEPDRHGQTLIIGYADVGRIGELVGELVQVIDDLWIQVDHQRQELVAHARPQKAPVAVRRVFCTGDTVTQQMAGDCSLR